MYLKILGGFIKHTLFFILTSFLFNLPAFAEFDETKIQSPIKESNEEILFGSSCLSRDHSLWDVCFSINPQNEKLMRSFKFSNYGENVIVPVSGFGVGREFEFNFEGLARSDMSLLIWDSPDEQESHAHLKLLTFFPREVMPAIRYYQDAETDVIIVTLPTREEVLFNGKTREVISGALKEGPMKQTAQGHAINPDVQYQGHGVVIEASALADWPVGVSKRMATIKKIGHKSCLVPINELWFTDHKKGGNVFFNKKLISDLAFDTWLKKSCGFSIY